jgi:flagellar protein FliL
MAIRIESPVEDTETLTDAPAPAPVSGGGFKAWLPLLTTMLVMPLLAYLTTSFVLLPRLQRALGITASARSSEAGGKSGTRKELVPMNKLLVNVSGTMGARYLLVSLSISGTSAEFKTKLQESEPQLRDMACGALASKTLADLEKPGARNLIRTELISGFNRILGGAVVQEIYLTEFAIQ